MHCLRQLLMLFGAAAVIVCVADSQVFAQQPSPLEREISESAREHYEQGVEHYEAGEYQKAADAFHRSYALTPAAMLLYNISISHWRAGNIEGARVAAIRAAQADLPPEVDVKNEARLNAFETVLTTGNIVGDISAERAVSRRGIDDARDESVDQGTSGPRVAQNDGRHVDERGPGGLFWTGAAVGALGVAAVSWSLVLNHQVGVEAESLGQPGASSNQAALDRIESKQSLGVPLLIGGSVATVAGLTMLALDLPGGVEASDSDAATWQLLPSGSANSAGISITCGF